MLEIWNVCWLLVKQAHPSFCTSVQNREKTIYVLILDHKTQKGWFPAGVCTRQDSGSWLVCFHAYQNSGSWLVSPCLPNSETIEFLHMILGNTPKYALGFLLCTWGQKQKGYAQNQENNNDFLVRFGNVLNKKGKNGWIVPSGLKSETFYLFLSRKSVRYWKVPKSHGVFVGGGIRYPTPEFAEPEFLSPANNLVKALLSSQWEQKSKTEWYSKKLLVGKTRRQVQKLSFPFSSKCQCWWLQAVYLSQDEFGLILSVTIRPVMARWRAICHLNGTRAHTKVSCPREVNVLHSEKIDFHFKVHFSSSRKCFCQRALKLRSPSICVHQTTASLLKPNASSKKWTSFRKTSLSVSDPILQNCKLCSS